MAKSRKSSEPTIPAFEDVPEKKLRPLGQKLDKLSDPNGFKHNDLLWKHSNHAGALLWHLVRHGLALVEVRSNGIIRLLGENAAGQPAEALILALRRLPPDMGALDKGKAAEFTMLTPGVLHDVDAIVVAAYLADREALMAARAELPENLQLAIDFVRRRAGETIEPAASAAIFRFLVDRHLEHGLALNIDVPRIADGALVDARLAGQAEVEALAGLFGAPQAWIEATRAWVLARVAEFRSQADALVERAFAGLRASSLAELIYLFGDGWWRPASALKVLDAREDTPAGLFAAAKLLAAEGTAAFKISAPQIKKVESARGGADEDEDEDGGRSSGYGDEYDEYGDDGDVEAEPAEEEEPREAPGTDERVRSLAELLLVVGIERSTRAGQAVPAELDACFSLDRVFESDAQWVTRLRAALASLGPTRAHALIRMVLAKEFFYARAGALLDLHFDAALVEQGLARFNAGKYAPDAGLLGFCAPALVPALVQAQAQAPTHAEAQHAEAYGEAILYILASASAAGQAWDAGLDAHIQLDRVRFSYGGSKVDPVLAMLDRLPLERWVKVIEANLARCEQEPWRLVRVLRVDTPPALIEAVLRALVARRKSLESGGLGERLRKLGLAPVEPLLRAIGDAPAENTFMREFERALDPAAFAALKAGLGRAIETPEQELRRLAASVPGPKIRIYRLRRGEGTVAADSVARIGGRPRGIPATAAPKLGGEPMEHILTLDLAQLPELAARHPGRRSLSLFLPEPSSGERHEDGELVWLAEEDLSREPGSTEDARPLVIEAYDVPAAIFEVERGSDLEPTAERVRSIVYQSNGYALGGPLWLQDGPTGVDPSFVLQFDEGLCSINLGDMGVMYVFDGHITWQCH